MQRADPVAASRARQQCPRGQVGARTAGESALILGAVIAGGEARRFGSDKARALLAGRPLIEHAADAIRGHVDAVVLCGREEPGWSCIPDFPAPGLGPLGGLAGALHRASSTGYDAVLAIGCDMPRVPADLLDALVDRAPAICATVPVLGCWPASLASKLEAHLDGARDRSVRGWAAASQAHAISTTTSLPNINTPDDLAAL